MRPRQVRYQAALRPDSEASLILNYLCDGHPSRTRSQPKNVSKLYQNPFSLDLDRIKTLRLVGLPVDLL